MARPRTPKGPPANEVGGCPEKPSRLSEVASAEWEQLVAELTELGTISSVDRRVIHMAALYAGYFEAAASEVERDGLTIATKTGIKAHPSLRARDDSARILKAYLESLGLTPASRSRVSAPAEPDGPSLEDILNGVEVDDDAS